MADIRIKDLPETLDVGVGDYVAVDNAGEGTRKFTLRQLVASGGGGGLTQTEKDLILSLFSKAAYAESDAESAYDALENLWTATTKTITYNLSHVSSSNTTASIESGQSYTTTLTTTGSYTLNTVTVTMGGVDITSTAYSSGTVSIPSVTGNIVITATAVLVAQSITATYTQSGTVYDTDTLDSLKADLVVTVNYAGGTSDTVPASDYTLSGTLTEGTSTITVSYGGKTDTFNVVVSSGTPVLTSITATYTQSGTVYDIDSLDDLKSDLLVTANYADSSSTAITDYTLSGTLTVGTSIVTVSYSGKTDTFTVTVTFKSELLVSDYDTFTQGFVTYRGGQRLVNTTYKKGAGALLVDMPLSEGDTFALSDYTNLKFSISRSYSSGEPTYVVSDSRQDYTLTAQDATDSAAIVVAHVSSDEMTAEEIAWIGANTKVIRAH